MVILRSLYVGQYVRRYVRVDRDRPTDRHSYSTTYMLKAYNGTASEEHVMGTIRILRKLEGTYSTVGTKAHSLKAVASSIAMYTIGIDGLKGTHVLVHTDIRTRRKRGESKHSAKFGKTVFFLRSIYCATNAQFIFICNHWLHFSAFSLALRPLRFFKSCKYSTVTFHPLFSKLGPEFHHHCYYYTRYGASYSLSQDISQKPD